MPRTGLAYVVGEDGTEWTLTKSTKGTGFATLEPGQSVHLVLDRHDRFSLVAEYFSQPQATRPS
jgi:hypothetical protein